MAEKEVPEVPLARQALNAAIWVSASPHEWKWTIEQQVAMARYCLIAAGAINDAVRQLEEIVCVKEPDDGVVLLSGEGSTHYDNELKCEVYSHKHFSPLGDALILLHTTLSSARQAQEKSDE